MFSKKKLKNNLRYFRNTRNNAKEHETREITLKNIAMFFFVLFLPTQLGRHFFLDFSYVSGVKVDYLSFVLYFTDLLVLALAILYRDRIINSIRKNLKRIVVLLFFLISHILISQYPILSFYHVLKILELYFIFIFFKNFKNARLVLISFLLGGLFQLILALVQLYQKSSLQGIFYFFGERYLSLSQPGVAKASIGGVELLRPYGTFSHPNSLAGFYLLLYFYFLNNKNLNRHIFFKNLSLAVFTLLIFISFSKAATIAYLILNVFYVMRYLKVSCRVCLLAKIVSIFIVAAIFLQAQTDPLSLEKRISLLVNGVSILKDNFLLGTGLGHYLIYQAKIPIKYPYFFLQPVHNIFVLFLAETGIVLGGIIFYFLVRFIRKALKKRINVSLMFCLLVVLFTGLFDHYWLTLQQNWLLLGVVFGSLF